VWNFRHNNRTSRQEGWLNSLEKHATTSILLTSEMHRWKFDVNIAGNQWSVKVLSTASQRMLKVSFLLNAWPHTQTPLADRPVNDLLVKLLPLFNQTCLEVTDVTNACAIHSLLPAVRSIRDSPPDSDQGCSVAITMVVWNPVSLESNCFLCSVCRCAAGTWRDNDVNITVISDWPFAVCTGI